MISTKADEFESWPEARPAEACAPRRLPPGALEAAAPREATAAQADLLAV